MSGTRCFLQFRPGDHVMQIYHNDRERLAPLLRQLESVGEGESILYLTDRPSSLTGEAVTDAEREGVYAALDSGVLRVLPSWSSYCPGGRFDPYSMMGRWSEVIENLADDERRPSMIMGEGEWLASSPADFPRFMEYESLLNLAESMKGVAVVCQYSGKLFREDQLGRARSVHCLVLEQGRLERNFWVLSRFQASGGPRALESPRQDIRNLHLG